MRLKCQKGYSLVEMMVSMAIFTVIISGLYSMLHVGNVSWQSQRAAVDVQGQMRVAIDTMARDLRSAQGLVITQTPDADNPTTVTVSFSKPNDDSVSFAWTASGSSAKQLTRTQVRDSVTTTRILGRDITTLVFTETGDDILIDMTGSKKVGEESQASNEAVNFRLVNKVAKR